MPSRFSIDYEIGRVDCDCIRSNPDNGDYEGFMLNAVMGEVTLRCGTKSISTGQCALLWLSRSLIRLCTFPVLYGLKASETVMETDIDLRSKYEKGKIILAISKKRRPQLAFEIPLAHALQTAGAFHRSLLVVLSEKCPALRANDLLLVRIPDGFALKHMRQLESATGRPSQFMRP